MIQKRKRRGRPAGNDPRDFGVFTRFNDDEEYCLKSLMSDYGLSAQDLIRFAVKDLYRVNNT